MRRYLSGIKLESLTEDGDSPVHEKKRSQFSIQSTTEHEKLCGNIGGPSPKAKYYLVTDSV